MDDRSDVALKRDSRKHERKQVISQRNCLRIPLEKFRFDLCFIIELSVNSRPLLTPVNEAPRSPARAGRGITAELRRSQPAFAL